MLRHAPWTLVLLALLLPAAAASTPILADDEGDCAVPHGALYLDVTALSIDAEDADGFDVLLALAGFEERVAEGAGYAVQFEHQGVRWGVLAMFRPVSDAGWTFFTGRVDAEHAEGETFQPTEGSFDGETLRWRFPKARFPHDDPTDTTLRAFSVATADLRTAYPFILAVDRVAPGSSDAKWLVCDLAEGDATYAFATGRHSAGHAPSSEAPAAQPPAGDPAPVEAAAAVDEPPAAAADAARATPAAAWLALAAAAAARALRRR